MQAALCQGTPYMFKEILGEIVDKTEGASAAVLMGCDGIAIARYERSDEEGDDIDIETTAMEHTALVHEAKTIAKRVLPGSGVKELCLCTDLITTVIRFIDDEYFVAVAVDKTGNFNQARFYLRTRAGRIQDYLR